MNGEETEKEGLILNGHPEWHQPIPNATMEGGSHRNRLVVYNSLVEEKVPFTPAGGRCVKWYTCGPTVYDVAHMGHARAYLTFDILRRIMEDYFGYEVMHQMNITDIDDKIILKARRNKLLETMVYPVIAAGGEALNDIAKKTKELLVDAKCACEETIRKLIIQKENGCLSGREREDVEEKLKIAELKQQQAITNLENCEIAELEGAKERMVHAGIDVLSESIDKEFGKDVTEHSVFMDHAMKYEIEFFNDLDALGVRPPTVITRVSEYVPKIVNYVEKIIDQGYAYESNSSVYFDTKSFQSRGFCYPKLCPWAGSSAEALAEGEGALSGNLCSEKKFPGDFALWKRSKPGEPSWKSPWGGGRPGWHIECSVMASDVIGNKLDVHAGGVDLKFPHHDNEMAQAEAFYGCKQWVDYFFHAGHLHIKGLKMSKSLKNFITIKQSLQENTARQLRLMFLLAQWDKPIIYSDQALDDAKAKESILKNFFGAVKSLMITDRVHQRQQFWEEKEVVMKQNLDDCRDIVHEALSDNFSTSRAMAALMDLVGQCNVYLNSKEESRWPLVQEVARYISQILRVFGVLSGNDDFGMPLSSTNNDSEAVLTPVLKAIISFRDEIRTYARENKIAHLLNLCDIFRDESCINLGIRLEDKTNGSTIFKLESPDVLRKEMEEKRTREREAAIK